MILKEKEGSVPSLLTVPSVTLSVLRKAGHPTGLVGGLRSEQKKSARNQG
jgi:hypothetical protein